VKRFEIKWPDEVPTTEFNPPFVQGMADRMAASWFKYGTHNANADAGIDFLDSLKTRLARYEADGNTEWLMDVANLAMIEFLHPSHPDAHFRATDSSESPGRSQQFRPKFGDTRVRRGLQSHVDEIEQHG
jgi:hypothetical protein